MLAASIERPPAATTTPRAIPWLAKATPMAMLLQLLCKPALAGIKMHCLISRVL